MMPSRINILIKMKPISATNTIGAINLRNNLCCFVESRTGPATANINYALALKIMYDD